MDGLLTIYLLIVLGGVAIFAAATWHAAGAVTKRACPECGSAVAVTARGCSVCRYRFS